MIRLSFIIPVYNTAHLLSRCLESIIKQNLIDIEIIVINDGSPDDVDSVMMNYQLPYIYYIKQHNQGISATRNHGIYLSKGKYIMFVDSDDYLVEKAISQLLVRAEQHHLHLIRGNFTNIYLNQSHHINPYFITTFDTVVSGEDYYASEVLAHKENMKNMPWMWLFDREFLLTYHISFDTKTPLLEDVLFIARCCQYAQRVSAMNIPIYYYVQYEHSSTNNMTLHFASEHMGYVSQQLVQQAQEVEGTFRQALNLYAGYVAIFALKIHRCSAYQQKLLIQQIKLQHILFESDSAFRQKIVKWSPYLFSQYLWGREYQQRAIKKMKQWVIKDDN